MGLAAAARIVLPIWVRPEPPEDPGGEWTKRFEKIKDKYLIICADDLVVVANNKVKKRRHSGRSKKEKSISIPSPKGNDGDYGYNFDKIGLMINDLIMWNDVAKSSLWFGFRSLCFLSSCFATSISFRNDIESKREVKLKEEDILRAARVVLPAANLNYFFSIVFTLFVCALMFAGINL